jgi:hypothetical protein
VFEITEPWVGLVTFSLDVRKTPLRTSPEGTSGEDARPREGAPRPAMFWWYPPSQLDSCRDDLITFLRQMGRHIHSVEAKLTKCDGVVFAGELWTVGTRELTGVVEEIATWITADSEAGRELEAVVTIRGGRFRPANRRRFEKTHFQRRFSLS